jgi:leucine-zipper of insertion element IS481
VIVEGWTVTKSAEAAEVGVRPAGMWVRRYRAEGEAGLLDRCSTPLGQSTRTGEGRVQAIAALRRVRLAGAQIAEALSMALSTGSGILTRIGLGKLSRLEPPEPANRYERRHPGELIHVDVKEFGRVQGGRGTASPAASPPPSAAMAGARRLGVRARVHR